MKKYLSSALLYLISLSACAQQSDRSKYRLPDGTFISADKLDSVNKAWGGHGFLMEHKDSERGVIGLSPMTEEFLQQQAREKADLNTLLNKPAPDFTLTDLAGKKLTLEGLKGKTVVLNFWFTTCPGCIQEMPELNELAKSYQGAPVVFLALGRDDAKEIKRFLKIHSFNYTHLQNAKAVGDAYKVHTFPTSVVVDPQGIIRFVQVGGGNIKSQISATINKVTTNN